MVLGIGNYLCPIDMEFWKPHQGGSPREQDGKVMQTWRVLDRRQEPHGSKGRRVKAVRYRLVPVRPRLGQGPCMVCRPPHWQLVSRPILECRGHWHLPAFPLKAVAFKGVSSGEF